MIIALCGFMGAGKSSVAKRLADRLGYTLVDTDCEIEQRENRSISDIFAADGESEFRRIETALLTSYRDMYNNGTFDNAVISLGGGTVLSSENRALIKSFARLVYLDVPFYVCYRRICNTDRPIVKSRTREELEQLYNSRLDAYRDNDMSVDANDKINIIADRIVDMLNLKERI